jgi:prefoldin subunit 5
MDAATATTPAACTAFDQQLARLAKVHKAKDDKIGKLQTEVDKLKEKLREAKACNSRVRRIPKKEAPAAEPVA